MTQRILILLAAVTIAFTACKKDDDTIADVLTSGSWKTTASTYDDDGSGPNAPVNELEDCDKDDTVVFKSDNTVTFTEGALKCDPSDPATESGTWSLTNSDKTLILTPASFPISLNLTIVSFTDSEIKVSYPDLVGTGITYETWTKI